MEKPSVATKLTARIGMMGPLAAATRDIAVRLCWAGPSMCSSRIREAER
jgi:hypothetical protein